MEAKIWILVTFLACVTINVVAIDVGRAHAKLDAEELLKLHRKRREDPNDKLFSLNTPRKNDAPEDPKPTRDIHIKLPDNISEQMAKGQRERSRLRDAFLGFPALEPDPSMTSTSITEPSVPESPENHQESSDEDSFKISHPKQPRTWVEENDVQFEITETPFEDLKSSTRSTPRTTLAVQDQAEDQEVSRSIPTSEVRSLWAIAWEAHVYFSGTLFVLLAIYCSVNILRLHTFSRLFSRNYFVSLNLCLVIIGLLRPIWLFHDPYNENLSWPRPAAYLLVDTGLPCMTTAFAVLFLALLRATQIELVSPGCQTPKALGIFCFIHFGLSIGVDVSIGMFYNIRYMVLILQGVFIVWSLLLSAGYFYIFSAMNKVAMRQQGDLIRSVYPKLILEGGCAYNESGQIQPLSSAVLKKPALARAVHLTLGVAVLGSLLGGVQLFAMIKMLGLIKQDMSANQNQWAWYGYQVSMRILEVTLCTLLAIIATTPLRSEADLLALHPNNGNGNVGGGLEQASPGSTLDPEGEPGCCGEKRHQHRRHHKSARFCCPCLFGDSNPPREFEDEIYSEICSNNHSVRQVIDGNNPYGTMGRMNGMNNGTIMMPLGAMNVHQTSNSGMMAMGSNTLMPYNHKRAAAAYASQSATLLRSSNQPYTGADIAAFQVSGGSNHHRSSAVNNAAQSSTSSRATLDTQLYSNARSRPSSMLFNDSGFVRFRMGNEPQVEIQQQLQPLPASEVAKIMNLDDYGSKKTTTAKSLRASQSFDETVLQQENVHHPMGSMGDQIRKSPIYHTASDPADALKDHHFDDIEPELEAIYEPPPSDHRKMLKKPSLTQTTPSESDEPQYSGQSIYARAPSECSSISATQSFDLRMYGRMPAMAAGGPPPASVTVVAAGPMSTGTLKRNEETRERLENPYYYYGSTRNQKKSKLQQQLKPRPLLPSQRAALEMQQRVPAFVTHQPGERPKSRQQDLPLIPPITTVNVGQRPPSRPSSRQALLQQELQDQQNFTRSRSLGGYYAQQPLPPPVRNQQQHHPRAPHGGPGGSMTPLSYAKWQHNTNQPPKKYNPLYDTPPSQRHPIRPQGLQMGEIRAVMGNASPLLNQHPHLMRPMPQRILLTEPVLSPILTDTEISPLHRTGIGNAPDYLTDPSDSDDADMFTSQATQGYSEGLADNELESEVSSIFGVENNMPSIPDLPKNGQDSHVVSPLEYSAMLKLYGSVVDPDVPRRQVHPSHLKDTTPDSGVVADNNSTNNNSNSNSNQSTTSSNHVALPQPTPRGVLNVVAGQKPNETSSQNSLLSSSSSTNEAPIWQERLIQPQPSSTQNQGKEYSRLEANQPDTLFSSSASSGSEGEDGKPAFRWDGTPLVDQSKDSKLLKKVKSLDEQPRRPAAKQRSIDERAPRPPKRDSSITRQKREEIK